MTNFMEFDYFILFRLVAAVICGGIIGWERGGTNHDAGLRTHIIVCLGSASIMVVSQCIVLKYNIPQEMMRMGAQIISGIGFLGAGSIIMDGNRIRGITTAAGLWATACVGIVVGAGYYIIGIVLVFLILFTMHGLRSFNKKIRKKTVQDAVGITIADKDQMKIILNDLVDLDLGIEEIKIYCDDKKQGDNVILEMILPQSTTLHMILHKLNGLSDVVPDQEFRN